MKKLIALFLMLALTGCATTSMVTNPDKPKPVRNLMEKEFDTIPPPAGRPVVVAVYSFADKTGQRRPSNSIASLSMAVTQGSEAFLIKALQDVGHGRWFEVVERVGIDGLTKERQLIRQMREAYEGTNAKPLAPMMFAGVIMEGGIVGYDSSTKSGGYAARMLGIGPQTQYSEDIVTISLRAVSVNTGKVLAAVNVQKTIYSAADSLAVLKFIKDGTQVFELEAGVTVNEPGTLAVKAAIEAAVVELIKEGKKKGVWDFKYDVVERPTDDGGVQSVVVVPRLSEVPQADPKPASTPKAVEEKKTEENIKEKGKETKEKEEVNKGPKKTKERVNVQLH